MAKVGLPGSMDDKSGTTTGHGWHTRDKVGGLVFIWKTVTHQSHKVTLNEHGDSLKQQCDTRMERDTHTK